MQASIMMGIAILRSGTFGLLSTFTKDLCSRPILYSLSATFGNSHTTDLVFTDYKNLYDVLKRDTKRLKS